MTSTVAHFSSFNCYTIHVKKSAKPRGGGGGGGGG